MYDQVTNVREIIFGWITSWQLKIEEQLVIDILVDQN